MLRALAAGVVLTASAVCGVTPTAAADAPVFAIGKCVDPTLPAIQRPDRFAYNCDGTGVMEQMTWTAWGPDGARGTGTDSSIECQPNCAEGTRLTNPIVVHAWNALSPNAVGCPAGVKYYADMTIAYPKGVPPWIAPGTTWSPGTEFVTVDGMPGVHYSDMTPRCN
jgi:hypothetical protein